jgi:sensor c-di-GMP phosphodiesterase-like protein
MEVLHITAKPSDPSIFWKGASGKWYRTIADAKADIETKAVNPADFEIKKSWFAKNKKYIIIGVVVICAIGLIAFLIKTQRRNRTKLPRRLVIVLHRKQVQAHFITALT